MPELAERLNLASDLRASWLEANDTFLLLELNSIFGTDAIIRGRIGKDNKHYKWAIECFKTYTDVDYIIRSHKAPTHCGLKYVERSRILFYRPSKTWGVSPTTGMRHSRPAALRFVRLKRQILTIFSEELYSEK